MNKLILGDCLEKMKDIPDKSVDMILADLPYGTTACKWDTIIPFEPLWEQYKRIIKDNGAIVLFGSEPFSSHLRLSNLKEYKYDLYWVKQKPVNFLQLKRRFGKTTETISIFYKQQCIYNPQKTKIEDIKKIKNKVQKGKGSSITSAIGFQARDYVDDGTRYPTDILKFKREDESKVIHPTQKPVALFEYLIKTYTNEGDLVLDNVMGSGTTGVACKNLNRDFIGIELDPTYFEIAKQRIDNLTIGNQ
jgi:site-specific DNA-methyltransferase (adenine-specific)